MTTLDELKALATERIVEAFPPTVPPSAKDMRNDHCTECQETVALFAGKPWKEIAVSDLRHNPAPSLLTPAGFRYYLPAMMLRSMEASEELDCFPDGVISLLSPPRGRTDGFHEERVTGFGPEQGGAILAFLRFFERRQREEWSEANMPVEALEGMPLSRVLARAIEYWATRRWPGSVHA